MVAVMRDAGLEEAARWHDLQADQCEGEAETAEAQGWSQIAEKLREKAAPHRFYAEKFRALKSSPPPAEQIERLTQNFYDRFVVGGQGYEAMPESAKREIRKMMREALAAAGLLSPSPQVPNTKPEWQSALESALPAMEALREGQKQLDQDGIMVGVSRQAIEETLVAIERAMLTASPQSKIRE